MSCANSVDDEKTYIEILKYTPQNNLRTYNMNNIILPLFNIQIASTIESHRDKTNKMACALSEDSDQPGHSPSLIRVFAVRPMGS